MMAEALCTRMLKRGFEGWRLAVRQHLERMEELRACIKRKKVRYCDAMSAWNHAHTCQVSNTWVCRSTQVAFNHFKNWYWSSFDVEVQASPRSVRSFNALHGGNVETLLLFYL